MNDMEELSDYELLRRRNIEENHKMLSQLGFLKNNTKPTLPTPCPPIKKRMSNKSSHSLDIVERRRSSRLSGNPVSFTPELMSDEEDEPERIRPKRKNASYKKFSKECIRVVYLCNDGFDWPEVDGTRDSTEDSDDEVETITSSENVSPPLSPDKLFNSGQKSGRITLSLNEIEEMLERNRHISNRATSRVILSTNDITEEMIDNIAQYSGEKVLSQDGTTCHQCRQKTIDQKTICRSSTCIGVRGQFCGPCLRNRYGESVAEALKNPDWMCPPCTQRCNCSICRTHCGKRPTGQLYNFAQSVGCSSVQELLEKNGEL